MSRPLTLYHFYELCFLAWPVSYIAVHSVGEVCKENLGVHVIMQLTN